MNAETKLLLRDAALSSLGIYCAAIGNSRRNLYGEGWNAAIFSLSSRVDAIEKWFKALPSETAHLIERLAAADVLWIHVRDELRSSLSFPDESPVALSLNMSDTFECASADAEDVSLADLPLVSAMWQEYGNDGLTAWAAAQRGREPLEYSRKKEHYERARADTRLRARHESGDP